MPSSTFHYEEAPAAHPLSPARPRARLIAGTAALIAAFVLAPAPCAAQDQPVDGLFRAQNGPGQQSADQATERARGHYTRGVQFYKDGDDKLALVEFRRSYELSRNYRILFNIGRVNQQLNNYADAWNALSQYLHDGRDDVPVERRLQLQAELQELGNKTALVKILVDGADAQILVDGVPVGAAPLASPIRVDVGDHYIAARKPGYQTVGRSVALAGSDTAQVELRLVKNTSPERATHTPATAAPQQGSSSTLMWTGWIGTGVLAAGAGVMGGLAATRAQDLNALRNSPTSSPTQRDDVAGQARKYAIAADVLTAAAVVIGGASLYLTLSDSGSAREQPATSTLAGLCGTGLCITHRY
jgi:tetratricopeptide (TPR) repeat protein